MPMAAAAVPPVSASSTSPRPSGHGSCGPPPACSFLPLVKMQAAMPLRHSHAVRAQKGAAGKPRVPDRGRVRYKIWERLLKRIPEEERPHDTPFLEEILKLEGMDLKKRFYYDSSFLLTAVNGSEMNIFMMVKYAIEMASHLMVYVGSRLDMPGEISLDTIKQTLSIYVCVFVSTLDDTIQRKTTEGTFVSFFDALEGVAETSHDLLQNTLAVLNDNGYHSSNFMPTCAWQDFQQELKNLKHKFRTASAFDACEILCDTLIDANVLTNGFVSAMISDRARAIRDIQGGRTKASDDGEPDVSKAGSDSV